MEMKQIKKSYLKSETSIFESVQLKHLYAKYTGRVHTFHEWVNLRVALWTLHRQSEAASSGADINSNIAKL